MDVCKRNILFGSATHIGVNPIELCIISILSIANLNPLI